MPEERRTRVRSEREQKIAFVTLLPPPLLWNVSTALSHILWPFFFCSTLPLSVPLGSVTVWDHEKLDGPA